MPHSFLPKRKVGTENRFPETEAVGVWDGRNPNQVSSLAEAISIPPSQHRIHSIPDPWARALLFDRALYDPAHTLHMATLGEWRGLLAMLALKERGGLDGLSARQVHMGPGRTNPGTFSSVLSQLAPRPETFISPDTDWSTFYTLRWEKRPLGHHLPKAFGFTSPMTVVCTGADYSGLFSPSDPAAESEVAWFDGWRLTDPSYHLSIRDRRALAEWIQLLSGQISHLRAGSDRRNKLVGLLNQFANALDPSVHTPNPEKVLSQGTLGMTHGLYRALDAPAKAEERSISDVRILTSKGGVPDYFLIEPTIAQQWNESAREIVVFRDVTLANADKLTSSGKTHDKFPEGFYWCTPAFFFSDRLIFEENPSDAFPGCLRVKTAGSPQKRSLVLPYSANILSLFTPAEIADKTQIEWLPNGDAVCHLQLTLHTSSGQQRPCRLKKLYTKNEMVRISELPIVCVWPDFRLESTNWKTYYTFQYWPGQQPEELIATPWLPSPPAATDGRRHSLDRNRFHVHLTEKYPEALICETPYFDPARQRSAMAAGILLLDLPEVHSPPEITSIIVGVDFGSTGSNVFQRRPEGRPEPIPFKNRIRQITGASADILKEKTRDFFIPNKDWSAENILSVFQDFGDPQKGVNDRIMLRDGHILYADDPSRFIGGDRNRIRSNLKWGSERERIAAKDFLMQLCMQAAAEVAYQGAKTVDIRFSYPTAFSLRDLTFFKGYWSSVAAAASRATGIQIQLNPEGVDNREAITATRFFSDYTGNGERLDITSGAITIDIGGGTTDIAVWNRLSLLAHNSIILAGRDIFLAPLRNRPDILQEIEPLVPLQELKGKNLDAAFNAQLDAIISTFGTSMIQALPIRAARESVQGFLSILETGLCGITFYSGLLLRRLLEADQFRKGRRIDIFVGGNGSKMFTWCGMGNFDQQTEIHHRAATTFLAGAGLEKVPVEIHLSARPKSEVAYGLVCEPLPQRIAEDFAQPMAAEHFEAKGKNHTWTSTVPPDALINAEVTVDREFPIFRQFLAALERDASPDMLDRLGGHVDGRFAKQAMELSALQRKEANFKPKDLVQNEPIFVMALKRFLEMEIDAWVRKS